MSLKKKFELVLKELKERVDFLKKKKIKTNSLPYTLLNHLLFSNKAKVFLKKTIDL